MRPAHLGAALPIAALLIGPLFLNRTEPFILGMPFLLGFITATVLATTLVMAGVYCLDNRRDTDDGPTGKKP